ncbi:M48 family metallopeptidase [Desulfobotulus sp. H1]|uniref:M48 family metallopeptidase n=1 Tax=Desulfobotulus pelophilus TaxID=2823377 RepID=A0ABT3N6H2_9BACT|nr:M48 family metallopeptidase [Desulfobotulus pelophilus]MCW7753045.1 M48 family metallopeptidase [Desulfobotulus pelophilus]
MNTSSLFFLFLLPYLIAAAFEHFLVWCNDSHQARKNDGIPKAFRGSLDKKSIRQMRRYGVDRNRFSTFHRISADTLLIAALFSGLIQGFDTLLLSLHPIMAGLFFFGGIGLTSFLISLPFDWAHNFIVEKKHGFSTKTLKVWLSDQAKNLLLSLILGGILLGGILAAFLFAGNLWWLAAYCLFMGFQLLMILVYPTWLAPLFNTFTPLPEGSLREGIRCLCSRTGLHLKDILVMDASKRTAHTNAYMTGLGKSRRIVLYDSLLTKHPENEILAILAHEIGHWKGRHLTRQLLYFSIISLLIFSIAGQLISWPLLYEAFGFQQPSAHTGLFLLTLIWTPAALILAPLSNALSRKAEYKADAFAKKITGSPEGLQNALRRMAKDNLANITPHPLYVFFHYSHPPLADRIEALDKQG